MSASRIAGSSDRRVQRVINTVGALSNHLSAKGRTCPTQRGASCWNNCDVAGSSLLRLVLWEYCHSLSTEMQFHYLPNPLGDWHEKDVEACDLRGMYCWRWSCRKEATRMPTIPSLSEMESSPLRCNVVSALWLASALANISAPSSPMPLLPDRSISSNGRFGLFNNVESACKPQMSLAS